jgi:phage gp36-like protein
MPVTATPITSGSAAGQYAAQADIESQFGTDNVRVWSQLDNSQSTADVSRIQTALNNADAKIISTFSNFGNYAKPLSPQGTDIVTVTRWAAILAGAWLYQSRGLRDQDPDANHIAKLANDVEHEMLHCRTT